MSFKKQYLLLATVTIFSCTTIIPKKTEEAFPEIVATKDGVTIKSNVLDFAQSKKLFGTSIARQIGDNNLDVIRIEIINNNAELMILKPNAISSYTHDMHSKVNDLIKRRFFQTKTRKNKGNFFGIFLANTSVAVGAGLASRFFPYISEKSWLISHSLRSSAFAFACAGIFIPCIAYGTCAINTMKTEKRIKEIFRKDSIGIVPGDSFCCYVLIDKDGHYEKTTNDLPFVGIKVNLISPEQNYKADSFYVEVPHYRLKN